MLLAGDGGGTGGFAVREVIRRHVEALAMQEAVLERGAGGLLQFGVGQVLVVGGLHVLMGEVDARDALVVGRERKRHMCGE